VLHFLLNLDKYLAGWSHDMGGWFYVLLFVVIFAETGLVIVPFLPGDSVLVAVGTIAATVTATAIRDAVSSAA